VDHDVNAFHGPLQSRLVTDITEKISHGFVVGGERFDILHLVLLELVPTEDNDLFRRESMQNGAYELPAERSGTACNEYCFAVQHIRFFVDIE
jgi:hypothetical protein